MESWQEMSIEDYEEAVYSYPPIQKIFDLEQKLLAPLLSPKTRLIEIGCGSGIACLPFVHQVRSIFGIDFSKKAIGDFQKKIQGKGSIQAFPILGDAGQLGPLLQNHPKWDPNLASPRLFTCMMNTLGTMKPKVRSEVFQSIGTIYRPETDAFFLVTFNARYFEEEGINGFYKSESMRKLIGEIQLCGNEPYSLLNDRYYSHWFPNDELERLLSNAGFGKYQWEEYGFAQLILATDNPQLMELYTSLW